MNYMKREKHKEFVLAKQSNLVATISKMCRPASCEFHQMIPADYLELEHCLPLLAVSQSQQNFVHYLCGWQSSWQSNSFFATPKQQCYGLNTHCSSPRTGIRCRPRWLVHHVTRCNNLDVVPYTLLYMNDLTLNASFCLKEAISERMVDIGKQDMRNQTDSTNCRHSWLFIVFLLMA